MRGNDQYPKDLTAAYSMIVNFHAPVPSPHYQNNNNNGNTPTAVGVNKTTDPNNVPLNISPHTFVQAAGSTSGGSTAPPKVPGNDGVTNPNVNCFNCNANGHYANHCPSAVTLVQHAYILTQTDGTPNRYQGIPRNWILLDSQSSISVFHSAHMQSNLRESPQEVCAHTNGGIQMSSQVGDIHNLGQAWYNPDAIANILLLSEVRKVCRVTMDTSVEVAITLHKTNGHKMVFKEHSDGLYCYDTLSNGDINHIPVSDHTFVNTIEKNKKPFVAREIELADIARDLYRKLGHLQKSHN
jgi:hypothetical protein